MTSNTQKIDEQQKIPTTLYIKEKLQKGLNNFISHESFGGVLLIICVILAMLVANSDYKYHYFEIKEMKFGFFIGTKYVSISILHFINDVLMSLFFLMVGLEMKREVLYGELAGFKRVSFSILSALGGILIPISIYLYFNYGSNSSHGFGVAMSTDTAFALGAILLLGKRIPRVVKIFLVTLAVFDDLGAILIIAFLYTNTINMLWLIIAVFLTCLLIFLNYRDTKYLSSYIFVGVLLWIAVYNSGIHATVAAVILAFAIPGRSNIRRQYMINILDMLDEWNKIVTIDKQSNISPVKNIKVGQFLHDFFSGIIQFFKSDESKKIDIEETSKQVYMLDTIAKYSSYAQNPLVRMELLLHPFCAYIIIPLFAFMNAGVTIDSKINFNIDGILMGTILGLLIGKPLGITLFSFIGEKLNIAQKPSGLAYRHIIAVGCLAGIGFTMSIFVANLAYDNIDQIVLSKISILIASSIAVVIGIIALYIGTIKDVKEAKERKEMENNKVG